MPDLFAKQMEIRSQIQGGWIKKFLQHVAAEYKRESTRLNAETAVKPEEYYPEWDYDQYQDHLVDEYCTLEAIRILAEQLAIVALYRTVELDTQKLLRQLYTEEKAEKLKLYR